MSSNSRNFTCQKSDGKLTVTEVYTMDYRSFMNHSMESPGGDDFFSVR